MPLFYCQQFVNLNFYENLTSSMNARNEFYGLIRTSFTDEEIDQIKIRCDKLEELFGPDLNKITALYYNLCGLFYYSAKDFNHFYQNFAEKKAALNSYTVISLNYKAKKETELQSAFFSLHEKITFFKDKNNDFEKLLNSNKNKSDDIIMALCNALFKEIEDYKNIEEYDACTDYYTLSKLIDSIQNPKKQSEKITLDRLSIEYSIHDNNKLKGNEKITITSKAVIDNLKYSLINYISFTTPDQLNKQYLYKKKEDLYKIKKKHIHRIIHRILVIINHYNLNLNGEPIKASNKENSYTNKFLNLVYEFINYIGIDTTMRGNDKKKPMGIDETRTYIKKRLDIKNDDDFEEKDINTFYPKLY